MGSVSRQEMLREMGRVAPIASGQEFERSANDNAAPCLFLLFEHGKRPSARQVRDALSNDIVSISHDPRDNAAGSPEEGNWLELLANGLTFDLLGLSPGPALVMPHPRHSFNAGEIAAGYTAIGLAPGPHIAGAASSPPVVRSMMQLGSRALLALDASGVFWQPAASVMGRNYFVHVVDRWLTGGPFPSLGLVAVSESEQGCLRTEGLRFFIERELVISSDLAVDRVAATRLAARLIDELVFAEPMEGERETVAPDGTVLMLHAHPGSEEIVVNKL